MKAPVARWIGRIGRFLHYLMIVVMGLAALGALLPAIPVLGSIGPLLVSPFGSWIVILSLAAIAAIMRGRQQRRRLALAMATIAGFAAGGTAVVESRQIAVARANGVDIDLARTLWLGAVRHESAPPVLARYGTHEGQPLRLAIYRPAATPGGRAAPVLVYVHGGGWGGGTLFDRRPDMRWFADLGYVVMSVEYTLSSENRHTWDVAEPQIACALSWIGANAARYGGDPARLALFGESAGGNLVLNVSYRAAAGRLNATCPGQLPRIAAVVAPYPVLDASRMYANRDVIAGPFARVMTINYTGGTPDRYPDRYAAISSPTHIARGAPPTLLLPGYADHLLPPAVAHDFARKAKAAGIEVRLIGFPSGEHSFDQMSGSIGSQLVRGATLQFLERHGVKP
ncbi:alpha/beta hydrolase [Sphingomonas solaris]|uniref:Alpha/beta hydrolase n=1 Tax=Alterirhizorhabdus solaris TaxID=2529389 RepID=A0A558QVM2_9SPHN|nr:alpha/beta hydrolase [Sphingomonas solaris]TVV71117.1 alpha/beta hydrolase [Sphingomonas solaris]